VDVLQKLTDTNLAPIKNYWFTHGTVCGLPNTLMARTGYTGEDGFEIYVPSNVATSEKVWDALYGHEISDTINVWEAGLDRYAKMDKPEFIGREALAKAKAAGLTRTLVGLEMIDRGIGRDGYGCCAPTGASVGVITSGSPSPTLGKNIALAYVPPELSAVGTDIFVEIRGQRVKARVVPTPFYKRPRKAAAPVA
jgi:aminomethyltransferase